jgi:hypothetical protein
MKNHLCKGSKLNFEEFKRLLPGLLIGWDYYRNSFLPDSLVKPVDKQTFSRYSLLLGDYLFELLPKDKIFDELSYFHPTPDTQQSLSLYSHDRQWPFRVLALYNLLFPNHQTHWNGLNSISHLQQQIKKYDDNRSIDYIFKNKGFLKGTSISFFCARLGLMSTASIFLRQEVLLEVKGKYKDDLQAISGHYHNDLATKLVNILEYKPIDASKISRYKLSFDRNFFNVFKSINGHTTLLAGYEYVPGS